MAELTNNSVTNKKSDLKTTSLITMKDVSNITRKISAAVNRLRKDRSGYALIVLVLYVAIVGTLALAEPMITTAVNLREQWVRTAINRAEHLAWSTSSPVRARLVDEVYKRVQTQLVNHIAKSKGSTPYECQGVLTQPETIDPQGGKLDGQFGLCEPEKILDGLNGLTGQSIDFLGAMYPEYKTPLTGENEVVRKAIIYQNQNSYEYKLTNTYVGQQTIDNKSFKTKTGIKRQEYYHWLVRADIEATGFRNVTRGIIVYYDVTLSNNYHPNDFGGGGNLCDRNDDGGALFQCPVDLDELGYCHQTSYTDKNGIEWIAGSGPCPSYTTGDCRINDTCTDHGVYISCPLAGGGQTITIKARHTRPQIGCASLNSGQSGKIIDRGGYSFVLTVRIVSLGNTYN